MIRETYKNSSPLAVLFLLGTIFLPIFAHASAKVNVLARPKNTSGLIGYWSLNGADMNATTAFDRSGNGYDGTFQAMGLRNVISGKVGQALSFDGSTAYISLPNLDRQAPLTWSFWVKRARLGQANEDFFGGDSSGAWGFGFNADNTMFLTNVGINSVSSTGAIADTDWHHIVVTYDGSDVSFYFDGVLDSALSYSSGTYNSSGAAYAIGRVNVSAYFEGRLDEVRMYDRVLAAPEVRTLYQDSAAKILGPSSGNSNVSSGLIGFWSFNKEDVVNGALVDRSISGNTAYLQNIATSTVYSAGRIGRGLTFDGSDDYAVTGATTWGITNTLSMSAWIKTTANAVSIAELGRVTVLDEALLYIHNNSAAIFFSQGAGVYTGVYGSRQVNDGQWHHVVAVSTGPSIACANVRIYVDGVRDTENCITENVSSLSDASPRRFFIGWRAWGGGTSEIYNGSVDDVRLYGRAISASEALQLYRMGITTKANVSQNTKGRNGLVGLWSFDGADMVAGTTAYDRSGNGYDGILSGLSAPKIGVGKIGQALRLHGTSGYVSVSNLDMNTLSTFGWINTTVVGNQVIVATLANGGWSFFLGAGNNLTFLKRGIGGVTSSATIGTNGWHYVGVTYDGATAKFYIDGVLDSSNAYSQTFNNGSVGYGLGGIEIGGYTVTGRLDDVRVYNRVLTASEIRTMYNQAK
ncbi:MAG: LamG domain-containing protein [bacterium]